MIIGVTRTSSRSGMRVLRKEERDIGSTNGRLVLCLSGRSQSLAVDRIFVLILAAICNAECSRKRCVEVGAKARSIHIEDGGIDCECNRELTEIERPD